MGTYKPIRCDKCKKIIAEVKHGEVRVKCKCGHMNIIQVDISSIQKPFQERLAMRKK